ncbi:MAG: T9SS type A sorting domain-containing protein [Bacteroidales bacterium]|nr:T9SS type A sorting domain-containing protein [Bacteroidales bacterium]
MKKLLLILTIIFTIHLNPLSSQVLVDTAVDFSLYSTHNVLLQLYPTLDSNKIVVIDFFNTSCGPCSLFAPDVQKIYEDYGYNQADVRVWGLDWGNTNAGIISWDSTYGITYPTVSGGEGGSNLVNNQYGVQSRPTVVIITPDHLIYYDLNMLGTEPCYRNIDSLLSIALGSLTAVKEIPRAVSPTLSMKIAPNPTKYYTSLKINQKGIFEVALYNLAGNAVFSRRISSDGNYAVRIDLSMVNDGFYVLKIKSESGAVKAQRLLIGR